MILSQAEIRAAIASALDRAFGKIEPQKKPIPSSDALKSRKTI